MSPDDVRCLICGDPAPVFHVFPRRALLNKPLPAPEPEATADFALGYCVPCRHVSSRYESPLAGDVLERIYTELYARHPPTELSARQQAWADFTAARLAGQLRPGARALEIGCHDGYFLSRLQKLGLAVAGIEPSPFAEFACQRYGLDVAHGFFRAEDFEFASFDTVVVRHVLEHVPDPGAMLAGAVRLLRPDGLLYVEVPNSLYSLEERYYPEFHVDHMSYFTPASLAALLVRSGFQQPQRLESVRAYMRFPFLACLARVGPAEPGASDAPFQDFAFEQTLERFAAGFPTYLDGLRSLAERGRIGVWGTGSIGTQFAIDGGWSQDDAWYVDPNEVNRGLRLSVTGHLVHPPATLDDVDVSSIVVASGWEDDALAQLARATRRERPVSVFYDLLRGNVP